MVGTVSTIHPDLNIMAFDIDNDPRYFRCDHYKCTLHHEICLKRQILQEKYPHKEEYLLCNGCAQGERILEEYMHKKGCLGERKEIMDDKKDIKICKICNIKPTISPNTPYCPSCMGKMSHDVKRRTSDRKGGKDAYKRPKDNHKVTIDFSKHPDIYKTCMELSDSEIRPIDLQIIFMLKQSISCRTSLQAD